MKQENAKLLLGLGIGALVGVAVGYLIVADNRKKLADGIDCAVTKVKDEVKQAYTKAKSKVDDVKEHITENVNQAAQKVVEKTQPEEKA